MVKRKSEQLLKENERIHKNTMNYFAEKDKEKKEKLKFRGGDNN